MGKRERKSPLRQVLVALLRAAAVAGSLLFTQLSGDSRLTGIRIRRALTYDPAILTGLIAVVIDGFCTRRAGREETNVSC